MTARTLVRPRYSGENAWRRPILAHAEETSYGLGLAHERRLEWQLYDEFAVEDLLRIRKGLACEFCLQTFPAAPNLTNLAAFKPILSEWEPTLSPAQVQNLVVLETCPTCRKPVRPEIVDHSLQRKQGITPVEDAAPEYFQARDDRRAERQQRGAWIKGRKANKGWKGST